MAKHRTENPMTVIWTCEPRSIGISRLGGTKAIVLGQPRIVQVINGPAKMRARKRKLPPIA